MSHTAGSACQISSSATTHWITYLPESNTPVRVLRNTQANSCLRTLAPALSATWIAALPYLHKAIFISMLHIFTMHLRIASYQMRPPCLNPVTSSLSLFIKSSYSVSLFLSFSACEKLLLRGKFVCFVILSPPAHSYPR